jgi:hypothetical protein
MGHNDLYKNSKGLKSTNFQFSTKPNQIFGGLY